jgi:hypothetical protein
LDLRDTHHWDVHKFLEKEHEQTKPPEGADVIQVVRNKICPRIHGQHLEHVVPSRTLLARSVCDRHDIAEEFDNSEELFLAVHAIHGGYRCLSRQVHLYMLA